MRGNSSYFPSYPRYWHLHIGFPYCAERRSKISNEGNHREKEEHCNDSDDITVLFLLIHGFEKIISLLIRLFHKIIFLHQICRWLLDCKFPPDVEHKKGNGLYWAYQENVVLQNRWHFLLGKLLHEHLRNHCASLKYKLVHRAL